MWDLDFLRKYIHTFFQKRFRWNQKIKKNLENILLLSKTALIFYTHGEILIFVKTKNIHLSESILKP